MIKLVVFDLWQTLAYREASYRITSEILKKFHPHLSKKRLVKVFEESVQTKKWKSEYKAFEKLCKDLEIGTSKETVRLLMSLRDYANSKTKLYPHTLPMLKQLKKKGYKIGLLSNSSVFDVKYLKKATPLLKFIDYPLFSFKTGKIKPDLGLFRRLLGIARCKPEEAIMVGDKRTDDILPAKKIGMNVIHFKNYKKLRKDFLRYGIKLNAI